MSRNENNCAAYLSELDFNFQELTADLMELELLAAHYDALCLKYGNRNAASNVSRLQDFVEHHTAEIARVSGYLTDALSGGSHAKNL